MSIRDTFSNMRTLMGVVPVAIGANGTITGLVKDRQGYGSVVIEILYGSVTTTGSVVTAVVKDGDVTGTMTSVADTYLNGTEALASLPAATPRTAGTTKEVVKRIGYKGNKRYVSVDLVKTGVTSVGIVAAAINLHDPYLGNQANP